MELTSALSQFLSDSHYLSFGVVFSYLLLIVVRCVGPVMWQIPEDLLNRLRCTNCGCLPQGPIYADGSGGGNTDDVFWCFSCSNSIDGEQGCHRQSGLELLLSQVLVPCDNKHLGCKVVSKYTEAENHMWTCRFGLSSSRDSLAASQSAGSSLWSLSSAKNKSKPNQCEGLKVNMECRAKENKTTKNITIMKYCLEVMPGNQFLYVLDKYESLLNAKPVSFLINGTIAVKKTPEVITCNLNIVHTSENFYEEPKILEICPNCKNFTDSMIKCPGGHLVCASCISFCGECKRISRSLATINCKHSCLWQGIYYDFIEHEKECPNVNLPCIIDDCSWKSSELLLAQHFQHNHTDYVHNSNTITKILTFGDELHLLLPNNKCIFVCKIYAYDNSIDFLVEMYANTCKRRIKYNVELLSENHHPLKKKSQLCSIIGKSVLDPAVSFTKHDIENLNRTCKMIFYKITIRT